MAEQNRIVWVAGPCSAETEEQLLCCAEHLKEKVQFFRAGLWKPRTLPSSFAGLGKDALPWLLKARDKYALKIGTEVATEEQMNICLDAKLDFLWLGARTTTNPILVQQLADCLQTYKSTHKAERLPIIFIKNPIAPDLNLWIGAIRRFQTVCQEVIAVHRGFKTSDLQFGDYRYAPVWSLPIELKRNLPEITLLHDPSHTAGRVDLVPQLSEQAMLLDFDGLMVEVHPHPVEALSDAAQQLDFDGFDLLFNSIRKPEKRNADIELLQLRKQIDEADDELWNAVLKRQQLSCLIGEYKKKHNLPVLQTDRYNELIGRRLEWGRRNGLSEKTIMQIVEALHTASVEQQLVR